MKYGWVANDRGGQTWRRLDREPPRARSSLPVPYIASDVMDETEHPCDGKHYTSKAQFRAVTRANGCIEVGNDPQRFRPTEKPKPDRKSIRSSLERARVALKA